MKKEKIILSTIQILKKLPLDKIKEVNNFADFILSKLDDELLTKGIQKITEENNAFKFLEDEEDLYRVEDLKEKYK
jgi:hypothetical protein